MCGKWSSWQLKRAEKTAAAVTGTVFETAQANYITEAPKRAMNATTAAMAKYNQQRAQANECGQIADEYREAAARMWHEYREAEDEGDKKAAAATRAATAAAWDAAAAAAREEAAAWDAAAAAAWEVVAAAAACVNEAEVAASITSASKEAASKNEQKAWTARVKLSQSWIKDSKEWAKSYSVDGVARAAAATRAAAEAHAWVAGAKAVVTEMRNTQDGQLDRNMPGRAPV